MNINYAAMDKPDTFVPEHIRDGIKRYIEHGIRPGSFVTAVIQNDLRKAVGQADHVSLMSLPSIVGWFYVYAPALCCGAPERMEMWTELANARRVEA